MPPPPPAVRTEHFFATGTNTNWLRTRAHIGAAVGVLGVEMITLDEMINTAYEIWAREEPVNMHRMSAVQEQRRDDAYEELRQQFADFFLVPRAGPEERKFVHYKVPKAIFAMVNHQQSRSSGRQATVTSASPAYIKVFSATRRVRLTMMEMDAVFGAGGSVPSFREVQGRVFEATRDPLVVWPGLTLVFVYVDENDVSHHIHNQADLDRVFGVWRQQHPGVVDWQLYAIDNEGIDPDLTLRMPTLM